MEIRIQEGKRAAFALSQEISELAKLSLFDKREVIVHVKEGRMLASISIVISGYHVNPKSNAVSFGGLIRRDEGEWYYICNMENEKSAHGHIFFTRSPILLNIISGPAQSD